MRCAHARMGRGYACGQCPDLREHQPLVPEWTGLVSQCYRSGMTEIEPHRGMTLRLSPEQFAWVTEQAKKDFTTKTGVIRRLIAQEAREDHAG